jgi:hypothetical protein
MKNIKVVDVYLERVNENSPAKLRPERRKSVKDRRMLHTYIADDRRSGLADRRKGPMTRSGDGNKES